MIESLEKELKLRAKENNLKIEPEITSGEAEDEGIEEELEDAEVEISEQQAKPEKPRIDAKKFSDEDVQREIEELTDYYKLAVSIEKNSKGEALILALKSIFAFAKEKGWPQKAVIFTESRRTQEYVSSILKDNAITFTLLTAQTPHQKQERVMKDGAGNFQSLALPARFPLICGRPLFMTLKRILRFY